MTKKIEPRINFYHLISNLIEKNFSIFKPITIHDRERMKKRKHKPKYIADQMRPGWTLAYGK